MDKKELELTVGHALGYLDMAETVVDIITQYDGNDPAKVLAVIKEFCISELRDSVYPYNSKYVEKEKG